MSIVVTAVLGTFISLILDTVSDMFRELMLHILDNFPSFFESTPLYPYIIQTYSSFALPLQLVITLLPILTNLPMMIGFALLINELLRYILDQAQVW
jgi:hypothetical protein